MKTKPLVSILIPNYNYSRFIEQAIESALNQTYDNIEIIVLDNYSTDNSMDLASKYVKQGVMVCRNPINISNLSFTRLPSALCRGDYFVLLCSDDVILPEFVSSCVNIMEEHHSVGYVIVEKDEINFANVITQRPPFFNCSFVAPGESCLPIYMMASIAAPSQVFIRKSSYDLVRGFNRVHQLSIDWDLWFRLSTVSDMGYIRKKYCLYRYFEGNQTSLSIANLSHPAWVYLQIKDFFQQSLYKGYSTVTERYPKSLQKQAMYCITEFSPICLRNGNFDLAKRYLYFARFLYRDIVSEPMYNNILEKINNKEKLTDEKKALRDFSYEPPDGFIEIKV